MYRFTFPTFTLEISKRKDLGYWVFSFHNNTRTPVDAQPMQQYALSSWEMYGHLFKSNGLMNDEDFKAFARICTDAIIALNVFQEHDTLGNRPSICKPLKLEDGKPQKDK